MKRLVILVAALAIGLTTLVSAQPARADAIEPVSGGCYCSGAGGGYDPASYNWGLQYNWSTGQYYWRYCYDPTNDGYC